MKRIILGLPQTFSLYDSIKKNLEFLGYEVVDISYPNHNFTYKNKIDRIVNTFKKVFLKDKHYKNKLIFAPYKKNIEQTLKDIEIKADFALLIRADIYPLEILNLIKQKSEGMISYHWDGLDRFPQIYDYIHLFDRFFVFDKDDLGKSNHKLLSCTNFSFDYIHPNPNPTIDYDVFYIGSIGGERLNIIKNFIEKTKALDQKSKFLIHYTNKEDAQQLKPDCVKFIDQHMSYEENISNVKNSNVLFDLVNDAHNGLSFRIFEALYFSKKIITNNREVKNYDLYHPNNIFIWNGNNVKEYEVFLNKPYQLLPERIVHKYTFSNWINYVLDIEPHTPTPLP